jgi:uncharacterized protein (TIGR02118 family)
MLCICVLYPNSPGGKFDHDYYAATHMPLVMSLWKDFGMSRYEIDKGLAGGAPGAPAPFVCVGRLYFDKLENFQAGLGAHGPRILADVANYTDIELQIQISETTAS